MAKDRKLKQPADYPQFVFRTSGTEEWEELDGLLRDVISAFNRTLGVDEREFKKNEVASAALKRGLEILRKEGPKSLRKKG